MMAVQAISYRWEYQGPDKTQTNQQAIDNKFPIALDKVIHK